MPAISVIMPVYNSEKYVGIAIESVLNQSFSDFELLLINDGSTDNSGNICDSYAKQDNRIRVVHQKNKGISSARNKGLELVTGDYVGFIDNDDIINKKLFEYSLPYIEKYNNPDFIKFGRQSVIRNQDINSNINIREFSEQYYSRKELLTNYYELRTKGMFSGIWDGFFKREFLKKHNIKYNPLYTVGGEDVAFCLEVVRYAKELVTIPGVFYTHYTHIDNSTSAKFSNKVFIKIFNLMKMEQEFVKSLQIDENSLNVDFAKVNLYIIPYLLLLFHPDNKMNYKDKKSKIEELYNCLYLSKLNATNRPVLSLMRKNFKTGTLLWVFSKKYTIIVLLIGKLYSIYRPKSMIGV